MVHINDIINKFIKSSLTNLELFLSAKSKSIKWLHPFLINVETLKINLIIIEFSLKYTLTFFLCICFNINIPIDIILNHIAK